MPRTKTSMVVALVGDAAPGPAVKAPPCASQPDHRTPSHHRCHSPLSVPRTNTSRRFGPHDARSGSPVNTPPSGMKLDHDAPLKNFVQSALSVPRTKTSRRLPAQDTADGPAVNTPP